MADKTIGDLTPATAFTQSDLLVMEQNGQAKSVTGQVLMRDLARMLDGHGGIKDIQKVGTAGLEDSYRITLSDGTKFEYYITNGRDGIDGAVGERGPSGTPKNWLDNSYFPNVVNQQNLGIYKGKGMAIDRWESTGDGTMTVVGTAVTNWTGTYTQLVKDYNFMGVPITTVTKFNDATMAIGSAALSENLIHIAAYSSPVNPAARVEAAITPEGFIRISIDCDGRNTPVWTALYIGEYTVATLPDYQYKGYAAELLECQRYYRRYRDSNILAMGYTDAEGKVLFSIPVSTEFKRIPVASELTGAKIIVDGEVITITNKVIPQVTSLDFNAVHFSMGNDFLLSDKPNKMVAISNVTGFELSVEQ